MVHTSNVSTASAPRTTATSWAMPLREAHLHGRRNPPCLPSPGLILGDRAYAHGPQGHQEPWPIRGSEAVLTLLVCTIPFLYLTVRPGSYTVCMLLLWASVYRR